MTNHARLVGLLVVLLCATSVRAALAQTTLFNVPTTDVVAKGKAYVEFNFLPQVPKASGSERAYIYTSRAVIGLGGNVEAGANLATYQNSTACNPVPQTCQYFQSNMKWRFYNNRTKGIAFAAGALWHSPINDRNDQDGWGLVYANFSKKVQSNNSGLRLHVGPYGIVSGNRNPSVGPVSFLGPRAGVLAGYEQPLHGQVNLIADWFSGKNFFGYFTLGTSVTVPGNGTLNAGYSIGNDSWAHNNDTKNRLLYIYYGVTF